MIQNYHESGYIEDLIDVHFADSQCYKQRIKQEDSRLEVQHHAGSFVMLCVGIIVGVGVLFLEHGIFKWVVPALRKMPGLSFWKSVHVMFFSQVSEVVFFVISYVISCLRYQSDLNRCLIFIIVKCYYNTTGIMK